MENKTKRTEYNYREIIYKKVIGIVNKNSEIRNKILNRNIGKYNMYNETFDVPIGSLYDVYWRDDKNKQILPNGGLIVYNTKGEFAEKLQKTYNKPYSENNIYSNGDLTPNKINNWKGKYENYLDYIFETYGNDYVYINYNQIADGLNFLTGEKNTNQYNIITNIQKYLGQDNIKVNMAAMEPSVLRTPKVSLALEGIMTTNVNNSSGKETSLGMFANSMYANVLKNSANFNTLRKQPDTANINLDGKNNYNKAFISEDYKDKYGMTLTNINKLDTLFVLNETTGREVEKEAEPYSSEHPYHIIPTDDSFLTDATKSFLNKQLGYNKGFTVETFEVIKKDAIPKKVSITTYSRYKDLGYGFNKRGWTKSSSYVDNVNINQPAILNKISRSFNDNVHDNNESYSGEYIKRKDVEIKLPNNGEGEGSSNINESKSLLEKTNAMFKKGVINTLINRIYSYNEGDEKSIIQSKNNISFGKSKGRDLLKKNAELYDSDPFCRVWTSEKDIKDLEGNIKTANRSYNTLNDTIRPFEGTMGSVREGAQQNIDSVQGSLIGYARTEEQSKYLGKYSVLQNNGLVRITPDKVNNSIKRCMFSIENLAWKDTEVEINNMLSKDQRGENKGRIMWFPPYNLKFSENVSVNWNANSFIGRGEDIFTYVNTNRSGNLSFSLIIDNPSVLNYIKDGETEDDDILRFFAGCGLLKLGENKDSEKSIEEKKKTPSPTKFDDKTKKTISFDIYFPNDYSGKYKFEPEVTAHSDYNYSESEELTAFRNSLYLLMGSDAWNCEKYNKEYEEYFVGYCMGEELSYYQVEGIPSPNKKELDKKGLFNEKPDSKQGYFYRRDNRYPKVLPNNNEVDKFLNVGGDYKPFIKEEIFKDSKRNYNVFSANNNIIPFALFAYYYLTIVYESDSNSWFMKDKTIATNYLLGLKGKKGRGDYHPIRMYIDNKNNKTNVESLEKIFNIIKEKKIDQILDVKISASVSRHGNAKLNKNLVRDRGDFAKNLLKFMGFPKDKINPNVEIQNLDASQVNASNTNISDKKLLINNDEDVKNRKVTVTITYTEDNIKNLSDLNSTMGGDTSIDVSYMSPQKEKVNTEKINRESTTTSNFKIYKTLNEYEYFRDISEKKDIIEKTIKSKIKYFDPAFHSITPEGFNERLNFLNQCTRQGSTISHSDDNGFDKTAGNLAFGRPPVCILRIGDFYNTKIIINSLTINYESGNGVQWDLNPEGAGVQPMFANVDINFTFLGGSDLEKPISQLQNAISFNYYANTRVYDERWTTEKNKI